VKAWRQIVIEGPRAAAMAFVAGFLAARGRGSEDVVWEHEAGIMLESFAHRIAEMFSAERHHALFAPDALARDIAGAIEHWGTAAELRVEERLAVTRVGFSFDAEVFSEELAVELRALLADTPPGTSIEELRSGQEVLPEAGGVELYSPQHEFTYRVSGRVRGDGAALRFLRELHKRDSVSVHDIEIDSAPD